MATIILFLVNDPAFFISHRLPIAQAAKRAGYDVHIATGPGDDGGKIADNGFVHHVLPISRSGKNPFLDLWLIILLFRLFKMVRPSLVHLVTIKPVIYGGIAARLARVPGVVMAISGLGYVYIAKGFKASLLRSVIIKPLYQIATHNRNLRVIFQNTDDQAIITTMCRLPIEQVCLIKGAGVDARRYQYVAEPDGRLVVAMAARLLKDKGVIEFFQAAKRIAARQIDAEFWLLGDIDLDNPQSITTQELEEWREEGVIKILGYQSDIAHLFTKCHIIVLPSYREGLPMVLQEAAACGRAVVTTDVPGCRDAIIPGKTGLLVPVKDDLALADAIETLLRDSQLRQSFGLNGLALSQALFSIEKIVAEHLTIYQALLESYSRKIDLFVLPQ